MSVYHCGLNLNFGGMSSDAELFLFCFLGIWIFSVVSCVYLICSLLMWFAVQSLSRVWLLRPHGLQHSGFLALCYLLEFAQTHIHCASDAVTCLFKLICKVSLYILDMSPLLDTSNKNTFSQFGFTFLLIYSFLLVNRSSWFW